MCIYATFSLTTRLFLPLEYYYSCTNGYGPAYFLSPLTPPAYSFVYTVCHYVRLIALNSGSSCLSPLSFWGEEGEFGCLLLFILQ